MRVKLQWFGLLRVLLDGQSRDVPKRGSLENLVLQPAAAKEPHYCLWIPGKCRLTDGIIVCCGVSHAPLHLFTFQLVGVFKVVLSSHYQGPRECPTIFVVPMQRGSLHNVRFAICFSERTTILPLET